MTTRRERVLLELEDQFSAGMLKAAGATKLLDKELNTLSGSSVRTARDNDRITKSTKGLGDEVDKTGTKLRRSGNDLNQFTGRLGLLAQAAVTLGPALVPIGAVGVPAVVGLAAGLGAATSAAIVAAVAFNGVGTALDSIDAYQLEPTTENLRKMQAALDDLGPAGADFARYLDGLDPVLRDIQNLTREGLFPGVESGIDSLLTMLPQVRVILFEISTAMGNLAADAGAGLSGDGFREFFNYLQTDAAPTLTAFGHTIGNVAEGLGSLMVAFAPLSRSFNAGMESMSQSFADWAAGLSQTDGFRDFVEYVRESGPQVADFLGAMATAMVGLVTAAAPVGSAVLPALTQLARVVAVIADSPMGPAIIGGAAAFMALSRALSLAEAGMTRLNVSTERTAAGLKGISSLGAAASVITAVAFAADQLVRSTDKAAPGVQRLTSNLLALQSQQGLQGIAGDLGDLRGAFDTLNDPSLGQNVYDFYEKIPLFGKGTQVLIPGLEGAGQASRNAATDVAALDEALAGIVATGSPEQARRVFSQLAESYGVGKDEQAAWMAQLPQFQEALAGAGNSATLAADATGQYAGATKGAGRAAGMTKSEIDGLVSAMREQHDAALSAFDAVTQYGQALKAAEKAAAKGARGIDATTKAGQENRQALSGLASAWNNQGEQVQNSVGKYAAARAALISTARQMGVSKERANELATELLHIPKSIEVTVAAYTDKAKARIRDIMIELQNIPRSISTGYYVNQIPTVSPYAEERAA